MKISYKGDYSLKVILDLTHSYPDKLAHIEDIAKRQDIPQKFLEQILLELKKGGFVQSKKGPHGGYSLAKSPAEITVGEILRFVEGSLYPISCVDPNIPKTCNETEICVFLPIWKKIGDSVVEIVDNINFEELQRQDAKLKDKEVIDYHI